MIVPMKKISIVVLDRERRSALEELKRVGVVHIAPRHAASPELDSLIERKTRIQNAIGVLADAKKSPTDGSVDPRGDVALVDTILALSTERAALNENVARDKNELDRLAPWGGVDPDSFAFLAASGLDLVLCEMSAKTHAALDESVKIIVLSESKSLVLAVLLRDDGAIPEKFRDDISVIPLPEVSTTELSIRLDSANSRLREIEASLGALSARSGELELALNRISAEIEFERARAGMELLSDAEEPHALAWLEGFAPAGDVPAVLAAAKRHGWAILADDPNLDDAVPTKVKNSALVRIIQPVFDFLGTVPNYREYDISAWFLLFFTFFFAMIFGDAGYGSILFLSGLALVFKAKKAGKPVPDGARLLLLLSSFTIFWGIVTLSWFGIETDKLPSVLKSLDIYWLSNDNPASGDNVKVFCFFLGTIQLAIAHMKNIRRDITSLKFIAQIGQFFMVIGMLSVVLYLVISSTRFPLPTYAPYFIAIGFALNFLFANWEPGHGFLRGLLKSFVASLANIVSVFLGVVNVFADIVSYIRLWAVGLAGLAISQTVNNMVGPLLGKFAFFAIGVLILVVGHGVNIILSVLSVIVHGVRLNVLEFSSHLGMEWSGFAYDPFRERIDTIKQQAKEQS